MSLEEALGLGLLKKIRPERDIIEKELNEAAYDLAGSEQAFEAADFKWAIVKAYYAMFHAARAALFAAGYRERRHAAISMFLEGLAKDGKLEGVFAGMFAAAKESREGADYRYRYSKTTASATVEDAEEFVERLKKLAVPASGSR